MNMHQEYSDDELIVNYQDACIYGRDWKLLHSPTAWLNDACIHFHLSRLQQNRVGDDLFLDPSVISYFVHQCTDKEDLLDLARGYNNFDGLKRIFAPVNDNLASSDWQTPGLGRHWSLLVILLLDGKEKYLHFDSVPGSNSRAAIKLARQWSCLWKGGVVNDPEKEGQVSSKLPSDFEASVDVQECHVPEQRNGYDCGIHVLATAEILALEELQDKYEVETYEQVLDDKFQKLLESDPHYCIRFRRRIAEDILHVAREANSNS